MADVAKIVLVRGFRWDVVTSFPWLYRSIASLLCAVGAKVLEISVETTWFSPSCVTYWHAWCSPGRVLCTPACLALACACLPGGTHMKRLWVPGQAPLPRVGTIHITGCALMLRGYAAQALCSLACRPAVICTGHCRAPAAW